MLELSNVATIKLESFVIGPFFFEKETKFKLSRWIAYTKPPITLCSRGLGRLFKGKLNKGEKYDLEVSTKWFKGAIRLQLKLTDRLAVAWKRKAGWNDLSIQDSEGVYSLLTKLGFENEATLYLRWRKHKG